METVLEILKIITSIILGAMLGFAFILSLRNYREIKIHRHTIVKLIDELTKIKIESEAHKLADKIGDLVFGTDKPEDLEKAIKDLAEKDGFEATVVKAKKKTTKKATKKTTKKENK